MPRNPNVRKSKAPAPKASVKQFYFLLGGIAVMGLAALGYVAGKPSDAPQIVKAPDAAAADSGLVYGYTLGKADAPVKIVEFADFECPACSQFSAVTEPDVRKRLVDAGLASFTFYEWPLPQHLNSVSASLAAACAADQDKFWPMHDALYDGQDQWNTAATKSPKSVFTGYAARIGLNTAAWTACYEAQKHLPRIRANQAEGTRRHVGSTPTFFIGDKVYARILSYDEIKAIVDSATRK